MCVEVGAYQAERVKIEVWSLKGQIHQCGEIAYPIYRLWEHPGLSRTGLKEPRVHR